MTRKTIHHYFYSSFCCWQLSFSLGWEKRAPVQVTALPSACGVIAELTSAAAAAAAAASAAAVTTEKQR